MELIPLKAVADSVRSLTMDAVERAKSGHPGLPLGLADLGALLYADLLNHDPRDPAWPDRDRLVLSAGHGSMLLYSLLHLCGYDLSLEDIRNFRQLGSCTPGHPEYGMTSGVEITSGPLGQGLANAVGMAIAETVLAAKFNTPEHRIVDHRTFVIAGDGCMMEGITSEAASLAGHLGLGKLIVFYDSNRITIEGGTDLAFSEDVMRRYESYGWRTTRCDAYDLENIAKRVGEAGQETDKPTLILLDSLIGKGAPTMAGTHAVHGSPLGAEEIRKAKAGMGMPEDAQFYVKPAAMRYLEERKAAWSAARREWDGRFKAWRAANPGPAAEWDTWFSGKMSLSEVKWPAYAEGESVATRAASGKALAAVAAAADNFLGGSADLAPSNNTYVKGRGDYSRNDRSGRNFHFGIREHAMAAICNGMAYHGGLRPYCATFLVFSDYLRPALRVSAIAGLPVVYVLTHDSIFVGEDGPTHEPVEHLASLRAIPNLRVLRPGDPEETNEAWRRACERIDGPTALILSRQALPTLRKHDPAWKVSFDKGAYVVRDCAGAPEIVAVATGSEVHLAVSAAEDLPGRRIRVVSMPCREDFLRQDKAWRESLVPSGARKVVIEAACDLGWTCPFDDSVTTVTISTFGESGPADKLAERFGFTKKAVAERLAGM